MFEAVPRSSRFFFGETIYDRYPFLRIFHKGQGALNLLPVCSSIFAEHDSEANFRVDVLQFLQIRQQFEKDEVARVLVEHLFLEIELSRYVILPSFLPLDLLLSFHPIFHFFSLREIVVSE